MSNIKIHFGGKNLAMFLLMLASVGNLVNEMLWTPSLIKEAGQIMDSDIVHSNKRLIFTYFGYNSSSSFLYFVNVFVVCYIVFVNFL